MQLNTVRRAQLLSPFGPGALQVLRNGVSVITAGLDHWFETNAGVKVADNDLDEFRIEEWRLQKELDTDYFMAPPEYRKPVLGGETRNALLTIPVLRFPEWFVCSRCGRMEQQNLHCSGYVNCPDCKRRIEQVRFIAMCDHGHIQDFPWLEWVHRSASPGCKGVLKYKSIGGGSLRSITVECLSCKSYRTLENVTGGSGDHTYLSYNLFRIEGDKRSTESMTPYLCRGKVPWLGTDRGTPCNRPLRAALRSATNVYYPDISSSIYLPASLIKNDNSVLETLKAPDIKAYLNIMKGNFSLDEILSPLRRKFEDKLKNFSNGDIKEGVGILWDVVSLDKLGKKKPEGADENRWVRFRRMEYDILSREQEEEELISTPADIRSLSPDIRKYIDKVFLIEKLRETRVLSGFSRMMVENNQDSAAKRSLLWRKQPSEGKNWLPAYIVYGEGIFITLQEELLVRWETQASIVERIRLLNRRYKKICEERNFTAKVISPRFVLLHTLSHLLINRLTFECGYSSAALRERLYISGNLDNPMAGILIYTSSGDSEGTLGGLSRMGKPENFEPLFYRALEGATWCSSDPVCREIGSMGGQGPDSCNLAACHSCCLVPETSCEEFNRFLDRSTVTVGFSDSLKGFFEMQ